MEATRRWRLPTGHFPAQKYDSICHSIPKRQDLSNCNSFDGNKNVSYLDFTSGNEESNPYKSDSYCSVCMTNNINYFEGNPVKMNARVKGVVGAIQLTCKGTIKLSFQDNQGWSHTLQIKDSCYAPNAHADFFPTALEPKHKGQLGKEQRNLVGHIQCQSWSVLGQQY